MALSDRVIALVSNAELVSLTNVGPPPGPAPTTVNATYLAVVCAIGACTFELRAGVVYDDADAFHYDAATLAVHFHLLQRSGTQADAVDRKRKEFEASADQLALTRGGRARILPQTTSELAASDETPDGVDVRPDFDRANLAGTFLRAPNSSRRVDSVDGS